MQSELRAASRTRRLSLGGIAGPVLFGSVVVLCGALRPDYRHATQLMSELGETGGAYASLMNFAGFLPSAALISLLLIALARAFPQNVATRAGVLLVGTFAVSMFAAGIFSCDVSCTPELPSLEQRLYDLVSAIAFPSLIAATFVWGLYFRRSTEWRSLWLYSVATGGLAVVLLVSMVASVESRTATGLLQRLFIGTLFLWLMVVANRMRASVSGG